MSFIVAVVFGFFFARDFAAGSEATVDEATRSALRFFGGDWGIGFGAS
jgi:hypothetical protein